MVECLLSSAPGPLLIRAPGRASLPGSCPTLSSALRFGDNCQGRGTTALQTLKAQVSAAQNDWESDQTPGMGTNGRGSRPPLFPTLPPLQIYTVCVPEHSKTWPSLVPVGVGEQSGTDSESDSDRGRAHGGYDRDGPGFKDPGQRVAGVGGPRCSLNLPTFLFLLPSLRVPGSGEARVS